MSVISAQKPLRSVKIRNYIGIRLIFNFPLSLASNVCTKEKEGHRVEKGEENDERTRRKYGSICSSSQQKTFA